MSSNQHVKLTRKQWIASFSILAGILVILAIALYFMIQSITGRDAVNQGTIEHVSQYSYQRLEASNGAIIHQLVTKPSNITLEAIHDNVTLSNRVGINGGFFFGDQLLSIAVVNGTAVNGKASDYGSGGENVKYSRGTLVWDGAANTMNVQVLSKAEEIRVKDYTRFWAQGGISMSLQQDDQWLSQAKLEEAPFMDSARLRSAAAYDEAGMLYLFVSETKHTLSEFRAAVVEQTGAGKLIDGIFLDGDGSSQLLAKEAALPGDSRPVVQMMRILK
ncbi:phosphodiester glycosidase family protein [Paenibacillus sp. IITD108]|uniref:phosphodiester glycosidase family protein n=1 Tax=Paenibacillus sp. IITD108 TaxID=3116649 RepID=UPI002F424A44